MLTPAMLSEEEWLELRGQALQPLHSSGYVTTETDRLEFLTGAALLRFHGENARAGFSVQPQQLAVVDTLACGHSRNAVELPRRSSKTTSLVALGLGRAAHREDYRVGVLTLTTGKAGRSRFQKDVVPALERIGRAYGDDKRAWPFKIVKGTGQERVEFIESGGIVAWLSSVDDLRGEAFDMIILDEAQAADPEKAADVVAAALPTLDTRPGAQIVVAGTAGKFRTGNLLFEWLEQGRGGRGGILEYALPDDTPDDVLEDWDALEPLIRQAHPGIGTLTTLEAVRGNWEVMTRDQFAQEYGGIWGAVGEGRGVMNAQRWLEQGTEEEPDVPEHFTIAAASAFNQARASIVAAWRDSDGRAYGYVLDNRAGTTWLADACATKARKHDLPVVFDSASAPMRLEVEAMNRMTPRPRLEARTTNNVTAAAALLVKEVNTGNACHFRQPALDDAAKIAVRRSVGASAWALGRGKDNDADISALEAWALALHFYDDNPAREAFGPIVAT